MICLGGYHRWSVAFPLVYMYNQDIAELLGYSTLLTDVIKQIDQFAGNVLASNVA